MTLDQFREKYGTRSFELIVRAAVEWPQREDNEVIHGILEEALVDLRAVLENGGGS